MTDEFNHKVFEPLIDKFISLANLNLQNIEEIKKSPSYKKTKEYIRTVSSTLKIPEPVTKLASEYLLPLVISNKEFDPFSRRAIALAVLIIAAKYLCYYRELTTKIARYEREDLNARETVVNTLVNKIEKALGLKLSFLDEMCKEKLSIICKTFNLNEGSVLDRYNKLREERLMAIKAAIAALLHENRLMDEQVREMFKISKPTLIALKKSTLAKS